MWSTSVRWRSSTAVITLAVVVGFAAPARAEERADGTGGDVALAERRAAEAFAAYSRGEYPKAVALYLEAYGASASASILYNLARIYDTKLENREQAIVFYQRYIASVDARPDLIKAGRSRLEELQATRPGIGGTADLAPLAAKEVGRGRDLVGHPAAAPASETAESRSGWSTQRWLGATFGISGLVGLGVGGAFGLLARSNASTAHRLCDGNVCRSQEGVDAAKAGQGDATISNIGFGAGAALLLTGTILYVTSGDASSEKRAQNDLRLETRADASAWALQLTGRW